jgi:hypothetical protein
MNRERLSDTYRREFPLLVALVLVGTILGGLLVGYEPVGGDPDRMYRPLKAELARALDENRLPFWSERFGLGVALVAESHVAVFYPPNLVLYKLLDVSTAYRLSMWFHYLALVATTYGYARCLGVGPWGASLSALAFTLCGFQAIHSSHEPFYLLMPYLPLALTIAERFMSSGRIHWLALLALTLGLQWTLGHFQLQTWTGILVMATGFWRAAFDRRPWRRAIGLVIATGWGLAIASVQLGLSWEMAQFVGQTNRNRAHLLYYSFPLSHWFELALPRPLRELQLGAEDPYWDGQLTTGFEAALYVGTIPLIFAVIGALGKPASRSSLLWRLVVPASFALATMPRWWPHGYLYLLDLPGLGYFRVPARYTLLTALGLAVLAGEGFDLSISKRRFRIGLVAALIFGGSAAAAAVFWAARADVHLRPGFLGKIDGFVWACLAWILALICVLGWRARRVGSWAPVVLAGIELGLLYYHGTTEWGWSIALPQESVVLTELARLPNALLVGGELEDLPIRANLATGSPYTGFTHAYPNSMLQFWQRYRPRGSPIADSSRSDVDMQKRWLRRFRVTHMVNHDRQHSAIGKELGHWRDTALDQIVHHLPHEPATRVWSIVELDQPIPEARVAARARTTGDRAALDNRLSFYDDLDLAWFLAEDRVPDRPDARFARLISWNGTVATVEHDGTCDLVLARSFYPGWFARIDEGPEQPLIPADGGFQSVRIKGSGTHRVALRYRPTRIVLLASISILSGILALGVLATAFISFVRRINSDPVTD